MDARYLQATTVLPRQNKVCGRTLRPFCLRHRVALEAIESPFLDPEKYQFNPVHVVMAARILSTYDKEEMARPLSFIEKLYIARMALSKKYYSRCVGTILGCIKVTLSYPKFWKKEEKERFSTVWQQLLLVLTAHMDGVVLLLSLGLRET